VEIGKSPWPPLLSKPLLSSDRVDSKFSYIMVTHCPCTHATEVGIQTPIGHTQKEEKVYWNTSFVVG